MKFIKYLRKIYILGKVKIFKLEIVHSSDIYYDTWKGFLCGKQVSSLDFCEEDGKYWLCGAKTDTDYQKKWLCYSSNESSC